MPRKPLDGENGVVVVGETGKPTLPPVERAVGQASPRKAGPEQCKRSAQAGAAGRRRED